MRFSTSTFQASHGTSPRGRGTWGFLAETWHCGAVTSQEWFAPANLTFTEAKKAARAHFKGRPEVTVLSVLP